MMVQCLPGTAQVAEGRGAAADKSSRVVRVQNWRQLCTSLLCAIKGAADNLVAPLITSGLESQVQLSWRKGGVVRL